MSHSSAVTVGEFEAVFRGVELPFGLILDAVKVSAKRSTVSDDPFRVDFDIPGRVLATVSEANLAAFLEKQSPGGLHDFSVKLDGGKLLVSASVKVVVDVPASATCSLEIRDGQEIWVKLEQVEVLGVGARRLVEKQLEKINPVLQASQIPLQIEFESTTASDGELIIVGRLTGI
jgi:hypothetical protein